MANNTPAKQLSNLTIEGARILFRNFAGKEGQFNAEGVRSFVLLLDESLAKQMEADGWNVKYLKPREEGDVPQANIRVAVSYRNRPPRIVMVTSKGRTEVPEDMIEVLDWVDIANVDVIINPYVWGPIRGETGIKAYLKTMFITIAEDDLERKYADVPEVKAIEPVRKRFALTDESDVIDVEEVLD